MKKNGDIVSYTVEELEAMRARGESQTDWARLDAMTEEQLEAAIASDPDWADIPRDWYKHARPHYPAGMKRQVRLRVDPDILDWFKRQGPPLPGPHERRAPRLRRGASRPGEVTARRAVSHTRRRVIVQAAQRTRDHVSLWSRSSCRFTPQARTSPEASLERFPIKRNRFGIHNVWLL
jgi:uncharacterized protein (DUF4415 family)